MKEHRKVLNICIVLGIVLLLTHYPEEVLSEPFFRAYHWVWRRFELWRY